MNITSMLVGITIMGIAAPQVAHMSLQPVIAQKTAENFGVAESAAVTFAAQYEGGEDEPVATDVCSTTDLGKRSWQVTCTEGEGRFVAEVTRAFRLMPEISQEYTNPDRQFAFEAPLKYSHVECPPNDQWGVMWYNEHLKAGNLDACIPSPAWSEARYLESNPDDWLYDLSDHGYGRHPDY